MKNKILVPVIVFTVSYFISNCKKEAQQPKGKSITPYQLCDSAGKHWEITQGDAYKEIWKVDSNGIRRSYNYLVSIYGTGWVPGYDTTFNIYPNGLYEISKEVARDLEIPYSGKWSSEKQGGSIVALNFEGRMLNVSRYFLKYDLLGVETLELKSSFQNSNGVYMEVYLLLVPAK